LQFSKNGGINKKPLTAGCKWLILKLPLLAKVASRQLSFLGNMGIYFPCINHYLCHIIAESSCNY